MKKTVIFLFFICTASLAADDFETQNDSYFSRMRPRLVWSLAAGAAAGAAGGYAGLRGGSSYGADWLRLTGSTLPENRFFHYIYLTGCVSYNLYEENGNIHEMLGSHGIMGIGLKISPEGFWNNIIPYAGAGLGYTHVFDRLAGNADYAEVFDTGGMSYVQQAGVEVRLAPRIAFFLEEQYTWADLTCNENYIPYVIHNKDHWDERLGASGTFDRNVIRLRQLTIKAGFRFTWGEDMFWFFPFFWEK